MSRALRVGPMVLAAACLIGAAGSAAEEQPRHPPPDARTWRVVAGPQYEANFVHRFFFGSGYRKLWVAPIDVEVLDMGTFSGGLAAEKKSGGKQTKGLRMKGADGREWRFRSIDKQPSPAVTKVMQTGLGEKIVQDQISASHPGNALPLDVLHEAAGILHVRHRMVVLPNDPRLGEFQQEFAGLLGTIEQKVDVDPPPPGFESFSEVVETEELTKRMDADARQRIDARAFLKARLFDVWIGDYDRHRDQWLWARHTGSGLWEPVPLDRDMAFVKFDGLVLDLIRPSQPRLVDFEDKYPTTVGITWQARFVDRRLLAELEWPVWKELADELQSRLTDAVIDEAARREPAQYYRLDGTALAARLKARRQQLPEITRSFYELLAREAEVHGTDESDSARLLRHADGSEEVILSGSHGTYFRRRFQPSETKEVRVFLKDGDDRAVSEGDGGSGVKVRLVGGNGNDVLDDRAGGHTHFYDTNGENRVLEGSGTHWNKRPYAPPLDKTGHPKRDWGHSTLLVPLVRAGSSLGFLVGAELKRTDYGFRKHPYANEHSFHVAYATRLQDFRFQYEYESLRTDNRTRFRMLAKMSDIEQIRFHGFGNETPATEPESFYTVEQRQYLLAPAYRLDAGLFDLRLGPVVKYANTRLSNDTLIALEQPYGTGDFGQLGARLGLTLDGRDNERAPTRGAVISVEGNYYPRVWSVEGTFGEAHGAAAVYATARMPLEPTLALRAGGKKVWGVYPFHEAAYIGGSQTVRGLRRQRYAGDASAFGNAELRLALFQGRGSLGPRFGVFGLADIGRVYLKDEVSDRWHTAFGGGLWLSLSNPNNTVSVAIAESEGRVRMYLEGGFMF